MALFRRRDKVEYSKEFLSEIDRLHHEYLRNNSHGPRGVLSSRLIFRIILLILYILLLLYTGHETNEQIGTVYLFVLLIIPLIITVVFLISNAEVSTYVASLGIVVNIILSFIEGGGCFIWLAITAFVTMMAGIILSDR